MTAAGIRLRIEQLGGMSGSQVARVRDDHGHSVILKASTNPAEQTFYAQIAPQLTDIAGISTPLCYWSQWRQGRFWLVLEDIPAPLPGSPRHPLPDERVLDTLARLHAARLPRPPASWWTPAWPEEMNGAAMTALGGAGRELDANLQLLRDRAQPLFAPACWISGDPNPSNWGLRPDGTAVLFDWARFGRGTPALDFAITIAGVGSPADYLTLAEMVIDHYPGMTSVEKLAADVALAKCWTVVELLASVTWNLADASPALLAFLRQRVPAWLPGISTMCEMADSGRMR